MKGREGEVKERRGKGSLKKSWRIREGKSKQEKEKEMVMEYDVVYASFYRV
jgi:hypothetical protein